MSSVIHLVPRRAIAEPDDRLRRAWSSWRQHYDLCSLTPAHCWNTPTTAKSIGDQRDLPLLKEVIEWGLKHCTDKAQPLLFTNDDVIIHPMLPAEVIRHARLHGAGTVRRVVINTNKFKLPELSASPVEFMAVGHPDLGRDGFVITPMWWDRFGHILPNFYIGAPCWDLCFAHLVRLAQGQAQKSKDLNELYDNIPNCELPDGLVIHEAHKSHWLDFPDDPARVHNQNLFNEWMKKYVPWIDLRKITVPSCWPKHTVLRYSLLTPNSDAVSLALTGNK